VGGGEAGAGDVLAAALARRGPAARRRGEQRKLVEIVLDHRLQREVGVVEAFGVVLTFWPIRQPCQASRV